MDLKLNFNFTDFYNTFYILSYTSAFFIDLFPSHSSYYTFFYFTFTTLNYTTPFKYLPISLFPLILLSVFPWHHLKLLKSGEYAVLVSNQAKKSFSANILFRQILNAENESFYKKKCEDTLKTQNFSIWGLKFIWEFKKIDLKYLFDPICEVISITRSRIG